MREFVEISDDDWFMFRYEDMVDKKSEALNAYLGFETEADGEVPSGTGKEKVVHKKAYEDWRHQYTAEGVTLFKPAYTPYMNSVGYICDDWNLSPDPLIESEFSFKYMQDLPNKARKNTVMRYIDNISQRLFK